MSAIARFFEGIIDWFRNLFWKQEMELTLVRHMLLTTCAASAREGLPFLFFSFFFPLLFFFLFLLLALSPAPR